MDIICSVSNNRSFISLHHNGDNILSFNIYSAYHVWSLCFLSDALCVSELWTTDDAVDEGLEGLGLEAMVVGGPWHMEECGKVNWALWS